MVTRPVYVYLIVPSAKDRQCPCQPASENNHSAWCGKSSTIRARPALGEMRMVKVKVRWSYCAAVP